MSCFRFQKTKDVVGLTKVFYPSEIRMNEHDLMVRVKSLVQVRWLK